MSTRVAIVGVNGFLGKPILAGLTGPEFGSLFEVRAVSRGQPKESHPGVQYAVASDEESYVKAFQGVDVVVDLRSAVALGDLSPVNAAVKAGVKTYVPSEFGIDYDKGGELSAVFRSKAEIAAAARKAGLRVVQIRTGYFAEGFFGPALTLSFIDAANGVFESVEGLDHKISFTSLRDIGLAVAGTLLLPADKIPQEVKVQSGALSPKEVAELYQKTTGKQLATKQTTPQSLEETAKDAIAKGLTSASFLDVLRAISALHPSAVDFSKNNQDELISNGKFKFTTAESLAATLWK